MHVVLVSAKARGAWSLKKHEAQVRNILRGMAGRHRIRVYEFANVGSHLHLLVRAGHRDAFRAFLRSFAGLVARKITGARRGVPRGRFWDVLAWSRIVAWGRDYAAVRHYIFRNQIESSDGYRVRLALERGPPNAIG